MITVGELALWMALLFAAWTMTAAVAGLRTHRWVLVRSAHRGLIATTCMLVLAATGIGWAFLTRDYSLAYPASTTTHDLPQPFALAALWSTPPGAALLFALCTAAAALVVVRRDAPMTVARPLVGALLLVVLVRLCVTNSVYARLSWMPAEGSGLPSAMQAPLSLVVAPLRIIACALVAVHLVTMLAGVMGPERYRPVLSRRLGLGGWLAFGVAALLAMRWAYLDPAWSNHWLTRPLVDGTVLVVSTHAVVLASDRRPLVLAAIPLAFGALVVAMLVAPLGSHETVSVVLQSRVGMAIVVLSLAGSAIMARVRAEPWPAIERGHRRRARASLLLAAVGCLLLGVVLVGARARTEHVVQLDDGVPVELRAPDGSRWRIVSQGMSRFLARNRDVRVLAVDLSRDDRSVGLLTSTRWQGVDRSGTTIGDESGTVGIRAGAGSDLTLAVTQIVDGSASARVTFEPLASWAWVGGALLLLAGALAIW